MPLKSGTSPLRMAQHDEVMSHKAVFRNVEGAICRHCGSDLRHHRAQAGGGGLEESEEEAKRLSQENAVMAEIGRIISSTLNIEEVYKLFSEEVKKLLPFDRIVIS